MIYNAPTWANNQAPAINAARLQTLCDAVQADGIEIQTLQQQQANPYTFKGDVTAITDLPSSGNTINDTYYVSTPGALYTWTGSDWQQSSVSASDYAVELTQINNNIGTLSNLTTTDKTSLVNAVNEVDGDVGDLSSLTTTEKSSVVGAINETVTDIGDINAALATKAEIDGLYEDMTVGNAEQIVSTVMVEDQEPYIFRTAGGSADIGDREYDTVVGGTLAWNQMVHDGNFPDASGWTKTTSNGTISVQDGVMSAHADAQESNESAVAFGLSLSNQKPLVNGHKYLMMATVQTANGRVAFRPTASTTDGTTAYVEYANKTRIAWMWTCPADNLTFMCRFVGYTGSGVYGPVDFTVENVVFFDLTQMFGSAIADYVYGLEQATPGAGVAWFRKLFPKDYYAYDAGSLQSVQAASHNTVGFNQWDEVWELGGIADATGQNGNANDRIRSKNYIPCLPDTVYYFKLGGANWRIFYYDKDKDYITHTTSYNDNRQLTTPNNAYYMRFWKQVTTYSGGICINLSWDGERNGEYEPYVKRTYPLDDSLTLRGIPKLDAANNLYYDGDTYESDGTVTRKYGIVDLGNLTWDYSSGFFITTGIKTLIRKPNSNSTLATWIVNAKYDVNTSSDIIGLSVDKSIGVSSTGNINVRDTDYTDKDTFTTAMSGVYLVYELATPTTETADPFQSPQVVDDFGTEEYVDAGVTASTPTRDMAIPVGHDTLYSPNLRAKLEMAPNSPADGDGDYIVRQTSGQNEYALLTSNATISALTTRVPACPTGTDGTFVLTATVSSGSVTYAWVAET